MSTRGAQGKTKLSRRHKAVMTATLVIAGLGVAVPPVQALAATEEELTAQLESEQGRLEKASSDVERLEYEIECAENRITEITTQLPERRMAAADTMKALYKELSTHNLQLEIIMNSDTIDEVMTQMTALEDIQNTSFGQINDLTQEIAKNASDNVTRKEQLSEAQKAVKEATATVEDTEGRLERVRNAPPAIEGCEPIDWSKSDEEIVAEWAPRIDAFLEGHALEGHGEDFVRAGIKYGVDPRFAASISRTESTMGDNCFQPFNAFGYMGASRYNSFQESIYEISEYLTCSYYNGRLTPQSAQIYCPPTWESWYATTLDGAQSI